MHFDYYNLFSNNSQYSKEKTYKNKILKPIYNGANIFKHLEDTLILLTIYDTYQDRLQNVNHHDSRMRNAKGNRSKRTNKISCRHCETVRRTNVNTINCRVNELVGECKL